MGGFAASLNKTGQPGFRPWENRQTALRAGKTIQPRLWREENAPLLVLRTTFPPEGELYLPLSFYSHKQFKV